MIQLKLSACVAQHPLCEMPRRHPRRHLGPLCQTTIHATHLLEAASSNELLRPPDLIDDNGGVCTAQGKTLCGKTVTFLHDPIIWQTHYNYFRIK
jgi:hypothetical protein